VADLPAGALEVAVEVGGIAAAPGSVEERARALRDPLRRLVPFQAACIVLLDVAGGRQLTLASEGYDEAVLGFMESPANIDEIQTLGFHRIRAAMRLADLPVPPAQVRGWAEYLEPAGFKGGLGVGLFAADGRHLGLLAVNTEDPTQPTEAARDIVGALAPMIANAVDPLRSIAEAAWIVRDATAGIIVTAGNTTLPLPGLPGHRLFAADSDLLLVVHERLAAGRIYGSFLCPVGDHQVPDDHLRITLLSFPPRPPLYPVAAVLISPAENLRGITARELEVLGLLVEGWTNHRMASALFITKRTVASHLEHILTKLAAPTRTLAAVRALRQGLYVPRPLNGVPLSQRSPPS
jgi:DNA-binding CsgD family transcriptional regulator